ncbi:hypothetical protein [Pseudobacter ginsenosidimutans]|uniref:Uncharacterized protein n=1 Tax=Pseudobacter ginsenosidimutans TaxID=661488 RepID=A0A4Q7MRX0_9BACT|nr:hypothetical protein [Pseudobacter ginsenosidimutans]QEC41683.1 hypothetical protein FSB84_08250 [Pseudobacter ginsenosidimutans]RZS71516.1 hypothetical protein EV199_3420 [Pseudobacter ginsenosidimutans]
MVNKSKTDQALSDCMMTSEMQSDPLLAIKQFFNGDPIEKVRADLENLRDTTITESFGDLDKNDKWLLVEFLQRISGLVEAANVINSSQAALG